MYRSANVLNVIGYEMLLFMFFLSQQSILQLYVFMFDLFCSTL